MYLTTLGRYVKSHVIVSVGKSHRVVKSVKRIMANMRQPPEKDAKEATMYEQHPNAARCVRRAAVVVPFADM